MNIKNTHYINIYNEFVVIIFYTNNFIKNG